MKKYLSLFFILAGLASISNGQTFKTFSDNFESYTTSAWLAQNSSIWTTWSGTPSTSSDDVKVTNTDSYSGSKSIYFNAGPGPEDVVLPFGGVHTKGQFLFTTMMKVPTGKSAYFNFQADSAVGSTWAVEISFETNKDLAFSNVSSGTLMLSDYPQGVWFEFKMYVNLTNNEWHLFIDDDYRGYFSNSINRVSFLDIYPADTDASFWMDDVSFTYAPASPNNTGIEVLTSPLQAICGDNNVKVRVVNNGNNIIDSVRVYWTLDSIPQTPVFVKTTIDTNGSTAGNRLIVTLDSTLNLKKGIHQIKAWTAFPNGVADTLNFDDTLRTSFKAEIRGVSLDYAFPFQGNKGSGLLVWPDTVCVGDTITYGVTPPTGFKNTDLGTGWEIKYVDIKSNGVAPVDTLTIQPKAKSNFRLRYIADTSEGSSLFKIDVSVSAGSGGCDTVITHYFYVSPQPHTAFTATEACVGKGVFFDNKSKGGAKNKYVWDFGDSTKSKFMHTSKPYSVAGTYNVTLKTTAPSGCSATTSQNVTVHDIPVSKFSATDVCDSNTVLFYDSSSVSNGSITSYYWEFGDGDTSSAQNPTHVYSKAKTYTARLRVTSDFGCTKTSNQQIVVHPVPIAAIGGSNRCESDSIEFSNTTSYKGTDTLNYEWSFGDGNQSTAESPTHLYSSAGTYLARMKVVSANGCMDSAQVAVEVFAIPVADFSANDVCFGETTAFTNNSSISSGSITSYAWNLRNGQTSTTRDTAHIYSKPGIFSVELAIAGTGGCTDTIVKDVEVFSVPEAQFTVGNVCKDVEVVYDNQSSSTSDTLNYQWSFGDGNTSTALAPKNTYSQDGTYTVRLLLNTEDGCKDSIEKSIEIYPLPSADFTYVHKGFGQYDFSPDNANLVTYHWNFGDGDTSVDVAPYHEFATEETFDVTLRTTDTNACTAQRTIEVSVNTGIAEESVAANPFQVYPNPFSDHVNIQYELKNAANVSIEIYSLDGKRMESLANQKQLNGVYQYTFNTPETSGIYMVRMVIDDYVYHERIVKAR